MQWDRHTWFVGLALSGMLLLGSLMVFDWARMESAAHAHSVPPSAQPSVVLVLDDDVAEIPLSDAIVLFLGVLGSGVLLGGMAGKDTGCDPREER